VLGSGTAKNLHAYDFTCAFRQLFPALSRFWPVSTTAATSLWPTSGSTSTPPNASLPDRAHTYVMVQDAVTQLGRYIDIMVRLVMRVASRALWKENGLPDPPRRAPLRTTERKKQLYIPRHLRKEEEISEHLPAFVRPLSALAQRQDVLLQPRHELAAVWIDTNLRAVFDGLLCRRGAAQSAASAAVSAITAPVFGAASAAARWSDASGNFAGLPWCARKFSWLYRAQVAEADEKWCAVMLPMRPWRLSPFVCCSSARWRRRAAVDGSSGSRVRPGRVCAAAADETRVPLGPIDHHARHLRVHAGPRDAAGAVRQLGARDGAVRRVARTATRRSGSARRGAGTV